MSDITNHEVDDLHTTAITTPSGAGLSGPVQTSTGQSQPSGGSTKDVATDEAKSVATDAEAGGRRVAETAKQQVGDVVDEARTQAREVYSQAKQELAGHAADQHRRAGNGLHALADELHGMVDGSPHGGVATDLAHEAAARVSALAGWFDGHEPGDALDELRNVARRRPGAFLAGAAVLGLVAGRLTRGGVDEARDDSSDTKPADGSDYRAQPARFAEPVSQADPAYQAVPAYQADTAYGAHASSDVDPAYGTDGGIHADSGNGARPVDSHDTVFTGKDRS